MNTLLAPDEQRLEKDLYDGMVEHAKPHIAQSGGKLVKLDYDPVTYRAQRLDAACVETEELVPLEWVDGIGGLIMDNYLDISAELRDPETQQGRWLRESGELMKAGESSVVTTSHKNLIDPGVVLGTLANGLRHEGFKFETAVSFYRMLSVLGYRFKPDMPAAPCIDVAASFTNHILQVITRTNSVRASGLMERNPAIPDYAESNNREVRRLIKDLLGKGGVMLAQAHNASVYKWNPEGTECVGERITPGTAEIMTHPNAHILEVNFDIDTDASGHEIGYLEICGPPRRLRDPEEVHEVAERMMERSNDRSEAKGEGRPFAYQSAEQAEAARRASSL